MAKFEYKNSSLDVHLFEKGNHPAILSNKNEFFEIVKKKILNAQ